MPTKIYECRKCNKSWSENQLDGKLPICECGDDLTEYVSPKCAEKSLCQCAECGAEKITWPDQVCDNPPCCGLFAPADIGEY